VTSDPFPDSAVTSRPGPAPANARPADKIMVRDYVVAADIGAFQPERGSTQRVRFNVVVDVRPVAQAVDDDVDRILSYDRITEAIDAALAVERLNLLETLADAIAARVLAEPRALQVLVRVEKLDRGAGALGVEIVRHRQVSTAVDPGPAPRPVVVYLSNAALAAPDLLAWIDHLSDDAVPLVLCVGAPDVAAPVSAGPQTQRRIALLAVEQNAWVLASRDPRCVVVSTRTELDWAMRNGRISVWAPGKIVLDTLEADAPDPHDPFGLAVWFSQMFDASRLMVADAQGPRDAGTGTTDGRARTVG